MMQPPALRLVLVRHGETAANREMRYLGTRDDPLTDRGLRQAIQAGRALSSFPIAAIYCSPLSRAAETAAQIGVPHGLSVRKDVRLQEGSFGNWEGLTRAEVLARSQADAELLARWESDPGQPPAGGESLLQVQSRVLEVVRDLENIYGRSWVVLVSHVGPIKALLAAALELPLPTTRRFFLDPASISVLDWGSSPVLRLFNSHAHLGWSAARWMKS